MFSFKTQLQVLLLLTLAPHSLQAWGEKGHAIVNGAATHVVPSEMPRFFHDAYPRLVYLGYDPDRDRGEGRAANAADFADHFIDLEYLDGMELPRTRYLFLDQLIARQVFRRRGLASGEIGFLPYRITELSEQIEQQWWLWKRSDPADRLHIEQNIIRLSGLLGHFVGDAGNPHHTTLHYNGWLGPNPRGYANDCAIHSRFESQFVSRAIELDAVVQRVRAPEMRSDYAKAARELISDSHTQLIPLYELDRQKAFDNRGTAESRAFTASRLAMSASLLRDLWWSAYRNGMARK